MHLSRLLTARAVATGLLAASLTALPAAAMERPAAEALLLDFLTRQSEGLPGEVRIELAPIANPSLLAQCAAASAARPAGVPAVGRTTVELRCVDGASWSMLVQATVHVTTDYLVARKTIPGGHVVGADDLGRQTGDLADLPQGILTDPQLALGRVARTTLAAGQPVRADQLRAPMVIKAGQSVRVVTRGQGFEASAEGTALNGAVAGDLVRVRTPGGQTISGRATSAGMVEIVM